MKRLGWILVPLLLAVPAFAQDDEEAMLRSMAAGATYSAGNIFIASINRGSEPLQQLRTFFQERHLLLTTVQERTIEQLVQDREVEVGHPGVDDEATRRINVDYMKKLSAVLTPQQRTVWRDYRIEQIKARGGLPALKMVLLDARTPVNPDQEKKLQAVYDELDGRFRQLASHSDGRADPAAVRTIQDEILPKVVSLLDESQRKALLAARKSGFTSLKPHP